MQFLAENVFRVEADSQYAGASLPEPPCQDLSCDTFGRSVLIGAAVCLLSCISCLVYNNLSYFVAERTPNLPHALRVRVQLIVCSSRADMPESGAML